MFPITFYPILVLGQAFLGAATSLLVSSPGLSFRGGQVEEAGWRWLPMSEMLYLPRLLLYITIVWCIGRKGGACIWIAVLVIFYSHSVYHMCFFLLSMQFFLACLCGMSLEICCRVWSTAWLGYHI